MQNTSNNLFVDRTKLDAQDKALYDGNPLLFISIRNQKIANEKAKKELATDGKFMTKDAQGNMKFFDPSTEFSSIKGILPDKCGTKPVVGLKIIQVTGIATPATEQLRTSQYLANLTGGEVVAVRNATQGALTDIIQSGANKAGYNKNNPAISTLTSAVLSELKAGREVNLLLHSQGAIIGSSSLVQVKNYLMKNEGLTLSQAEAKMSHIHVYTIGGASGKFTNGPQYNHDLNTNDLVPTSIGLGIGYAHDNPRLHIGPAQATVVVHGDVTPNKATSVTPKTYPISASSPGKGAVINYFTDSQPRPGDAKLPVYGGHHFDIYMRHLDTSFFVPSKK